MEDYRSRSYSDMGRNNNNNNNMQMEVYRGGDGGGLPPPPLSHDFRSYSTSHAYNHHQNSSSYSWQQPKEMKLKKGKSTTSSSSASGAGWSLNDPELQRRKRVASYKVYSVEGKVKGSFRKSFRWLKDRYTQGMKSNTIVWFQVFLVGGLLLLRLFAHNLLFGRGQ